MKNFFVCIILLVIFNGCGPVKEPHAEENSDQNTSTPLQRDLVVDSSSGFVDLKLSISSIEKKDTASIIHVSSIFEGNEIGFDAFIPDNAKKSGFGHGMIISSTGAKSDNFLKMLARFYHVKLEADAKFCKGDTIAFADLNQMGQNQGGVNISTNDLKLFFEKEGKTEDDSQYAEVYLNIGKGIGAVEFNEKDPEYREALIKFLTEKKQ